MKIQVKDVHEEDAWTRLLEVEVDGDHVREQIDDRLRTLRRGLNLPGFRKGKVPLADVRRRFGKEVRDEILEEVITEAVRQALTEQEFDLLGSPHIEGVELEAEGPLTFKARLDVRPPIELGEYGDLKIDKMVRQIGDDDVQAVLEELRLSRAELEAVDRPAEEQDVVTVNLTSLGPGQVPIVGTHKEAIRVLLNEAAVPPQWLSGLVGLSAGQTVTVEQPRLEEERRRQPGVVEAGGDQRYDQLELVKVEARRVPALDDDFAREVARLETVDELRERVRQNLVEEEDRKARKQVERQILDRLAEPLKLDIPERLVRRAADDLYETALRQHPDLGDEARESLAVEAAKEAARRLRHELVIAEVGRREQIEVPRQEAEETFRQLVKGGMEPSDDPASRERMIDGLRDSIYERKVLNLLVDRADVQVIEQSGQTKRIVTPWDS